MGDITELKEGPKEEEKEDIVVKATKSYPKIDTSMPHISSYIRSIYSVIQADATLKESVIEVVCQPFPKDPFMILAHM